MGKDMPGHARQHSDVSCAKVAEPIDLPFGLWTRMGRREHKLKRSRQVAPICGYTKSRPQGRTTHRLDDRILCGRAVDYYSTFIWADFSFRVSNTKSSEVIQ